MPVDICTSFFDSNEEILNLAYCLNIHYVTSAMTIMFLTNIFIEIAVA